MEFATWQFSIFAAGSPLAFRRQDDDRFLLDKSGQWIGWFPWDAADDADKNGTYLGTVDYEGTISPTPDTGISRPDNPVRRVRFGIL